LKIKRSSEKDTETIRSIKGLIRSCEAKATCKYVGLNDEHIHFMNLPFYETGTIEKKPLSKEDVDLTVELLNSVQPQQVYCAGDFADPHGTHKVCFDVVMAALKQIKDSGATWINDCWLWLYKGAWQEWDIPEIDMAIPMSPDQVVKKRHGIFIHQSQKDIVPFLGSDDREFWQRAEERNASTAQLYARLGLTQYAAMEAFVRYEFS
jgi:glucosamine-6-phosphate deaminase